MQRRNKQLLEKVVATNLKNTLDDSLDAETRNESFKQAMRAAEILSEADKVENDATKAEAEKIRALNDKDKIKLESSRIENESKSAGNDIRRVKVDHIIKIAELGATIVIIPLMDYAFKVKYANLICDFERDSSLISTAGRSLSQLLFRSKR